MKINTIDREFEAHTVLELDVFELHCMEKFFNVMIKRINLGEEGFNSAEVPEIERIAKKLKDHRELFKI